MPSHTSFDPQAEELFFAFRREVESGGTPEFDALCRAHPEHEQALRAMRSLEAFAERMACQAGPQRSVAERLRELHGDSLGSSPSLDGAPPANSALRSELYARLRGIEPRGTRYQVLGELARGGMGAILRIWDGELRRTLAMKVVLEQGARAGATASGADPRTLGRFLEEAQITGQLDHPGIVPVHELGLDAAGRLYFTMKLVRGEDLKTVFEHVKSRADGWNEVRALNVLLRVCEAVAYAHAKKVIHRDLKPANVMVGKFGEVYVMDWGLARVLGREDRHDLRIRPPSAASLSTVKTERREQRESAADSPLVTMDGDIVGTPSYMAPEQARGELERLGPHSDVYSIGAMLYQLVTGRAPFVPDLAPVPPHALLLRVREGPPRPAQELAPHAPAELIAIVERAMAREIDERYRDTVELAEDLRAYIEGRVVRAYETGAWAEARKWVRRNRPLAASLAAALLAVTAGAALFAWKANEAETARAEAEQKTRDVLALSAQKEHDDLIAEAAALWPAEPAMLPRYQDWLRRANDLIAGRRTDDKSAAVQLPGLEQHKAKLAELQRDEGSLRAALSLRADKPRAESTELQANAWWQRQLRKLVADLEALSEPRTGLMSACVSEPFCWGVAKRYEFAKSIGERSVDGPQARQLWSEAIAAIRSSPKYGGLELAPQMGLLPLGMDPDSQLWEFAHLQSGTPAARGADGKLVLTEGTGLVFVLVPGGRFVRGAQADSPTGPNYDSAAERDEGPPREIELSTYFVSKYEMTQGQWQRLAGANPSKHDSVDYDTTWNRDGDDWSELHPVEHVSWRMCVELLACMGLALPSEAQWEYAARGGTRSVYSSGDKRGSLEGFANLNDAYAQANGGEMFGAGESFDDGHTSHAPVGSYQPNGFGLHDVHGNVWEWCQDGYDSSYYYVSVAVNPVESWDNASYHVSRGGAFVSSATAARSACRNATSPEDRSFTLGLRPVRAVQRAN